MQRVSSCFQTTELKCCLSRAQFNIVGHLDGAARRYLLPADGRIARGASLEEVHMK